MNNINIIAPIISHQRSITNFLDKKVSSATKKDLAHP